MENKKFYDRFQEKFLEWFDAQDEKLQQELLDDEVGTVTEHDLFDATEDKGENFRNIARSVRIESWYVDIVEADRLGGYEDFDLTGVLKNIVSEVADMNWSFAEWLVDDYVNEILEYRSSPESFFKDLQTGGCIGGMIGGLIYCDDIRKKYIEYMDDMDYYIAEMEGEMGSPIQGWNEHHSTIPRFNLVVWAVYEEFAYQIWRELFEEY